MILKPYVRTPPIRPVAVMYGYTVTDEAGTVYRGLDRVPAGVAVYAEREAGVHTAQRQGGTLNLWNGEPTRYVQGARSAYLHTFEATPEAMLEALVAVRDWLGHQGASVGSLGHMGTSLARASLSRPVYLDSGDPPPLKPPIGGRQEGQSPGFYGPFDMWDLRAAYASTLGSLLTGGSWRELPAREWHVLDAYEGMPCFIHGRVRLPWNSTNSKASSSPSDPDPTDRTTSSLRWGPLPRRGGKAGGRRARANYRRPFPTQGQVTGTWTLEEIRAAEAVGATVTVDRIWVQAAGTAPMSAWWSLVESGRSELTGLSRTILKAAGNAFVGTLVMEGERRAVAYRDGKPGRPKVLPSRPATTNAAATWETVTGRVRARLYADVMVPAGDSLVSVHTDGALILHPPEPGHVQTSMLAALPRERFTPWSVWSVATVGDPVTSTPTRDGSDVQNAASGPAAVDAKAWHGAYADDQSSRGSPFPSSGSTSVPVVTGTKPAASASPWRLKATGGRLYYLGPQLYLWTDPAGGEHYVVSGSRTADAPAAFWRAAAEELHIPKLPRPSERQRARRALMEAYPTLTHAEAWAELDSWFDAPITTTDRKELEAMLR